MEASLSRAARGKSGVFGTAGLCVNMLLDARIVGLGSSGAGGKGNGALQPAVEQQGARATTHNLSDQDFEKAWAWLIREFRQIWLLNDGLKERLKKRTEDLNRLEKFTLDHNLRSAFKSWLRRMVGNTHCADAVVNHPAQ